MVLKQIEIKNFSFIIKLTKVGQYTKHNLKFYSNLNMFKLDDGKNKIEKVYSDSDQSNIIFIKYKNDNVLKGFYLDGLELF